MICQKCGTPLNENAKFCTTCGSEIIMEDDKHIEDAVYPDLNTVFSEPQAEDSDYEQQFYKNSQNNYEPNIVNRTHKSNIIYKVITGIAFILLLWIMVENDSLKRQIDGYDNRGTIEKSVDAIDAWWDTIFE